MCGIFFCISDVSDCDCVNDRVKCQELISRRGPDHFHEFNTRISSSLHLECWSSVLWLQVNTLFSLVDRRKYLSLIGWLEIQNSSKIGWYRETRFADNHWLVKILTAFLCGMETSSTDTRLLRNMIKTFVILMKSLIPLSCQDCCFTPLKVN